MKRCISCIIEGRNKVTNCLVALHLKMFQVIDQYVFDVCLCSRLRSSSVSRRRRREGDCYYVTQHAPTRKEVFEHTIDSLYELQV